MCKVLAILMENIVNVLFVVQHTKTYFTRNYQSSNFNYQFVAVGIPFKLIAIWFLRACTQFRCRRWPMVNANLMNFLWMDDLSYRSQLNPSGLKGRAVFNAFALIPQPNNFSDSQYVEFDRYLLTKQALLPHASVCLQTQKRIVSTNKRRSTSWIPECRFFHISSILIRIECYLRTHRDS